MAAQCDYLGQISCHNLVQHFGTKWGFGYSQSEIHLDKFDWFFGWCRMQRRRKVDRLHSQWLRERVQGVVLVQVGLSWGSYTKQYRLPMAQAKSGSSRLCIKEAAANHTIFNFGGRFFYLL